MRRLIPAVASKPCIRLRSSRIPTTRYLHIQAIPTNRPISIANESYISASTSNSALSPDARFEIVGSPYSLLSASLSASQNLYTRRGTLVGLSGKSDNVVSALRLLTPFRRSVLGIPFLYQKISSTTPVTALISVRSPITSFALLQLDGTVDWMLAQRKALLAWTGHSMRVSPRAHRQLSIIHWGNTEVTGRGLVAITGNGQIYSVELKEGEQYIAHPSNVLAYTLTSLPPQPYRFKSTTLRFQVPSLGVGSWLSKSNFIKNMSGSDTWKAVRGIFYTLRIWTRKTIWGDRLFLQFNGPATILIQSRASRLNDSLTDQQVNEIADSPAGTVEAAVDAATPPLPTEEHSGLEHAKAEKVVRQSIANVRRDGKVEFKPPLNEQ